MKLKILGVSLIIVSVVGYIYLNISIYNKYSKHQEVIDNIFINGKPNTTNYVGYIKIDQINIRKGIVSGITSDILNNDDVGMLKNDNIILAGHAVSNVFGNLEKIKISAKIEIYLYDGFENYIVYEKIVVDKNNLDYLYADLVLITCTRDDKRLLVLAKKDM